MGLCEVATFTMIMFVYTSNNVGHFDLQWFCFSQLNHKVNMSVP